MAPERINTDSRENKQARKDPDVDSGSESEAQNRQLVPVTQPSRAHTTNSPDAPQRPTNKFPRFNKMPKPSIGTKTLESGLVITATPKGGFPAPQLGDSVWRNIAQRQKVAWPSKKGGKVWVRVFRGAYKENAQDTVEKFYEIIPKLIGEANTQNLVISTPSSERAMNVRLPPPYHFLISGLGDDATQLLVNLAMCSTQDVTCFFVPYDQPIPTYIGTLENFSLPDSPNSNNVIADIVKTALKKSPDVTTFIHENTSNPSKEAAARAIDSIRVTSLRVATARTGKRTVWNVYCDSPPDFNLEAYYEWTKKIRLIPFTSEDNGTGAMRLGERQFMCTGCKSFDHPTWACPFSRLPGWFGPPPSVDDGMTMMEDTVKSPRNSSRQTSPTKGRGQPRGGPRRGRGRF